MKEYITKDRAKQFVCGHCNEVCSEEPCEPSDCDWMAFIDKEPAADPIHEMDGCYCWECEKENNGYCKKLRGMPTLEPLKLNTEKICLVVPIELSQLRYDLCENCKKKLEKWLEE